MKYRLTLGLLRSKRSALLTSAGSDVESYETARRQFYEAFDAVQTVHRSLHDENLRRSKRHAFRRARARLRNTFHKLLSSLWEVHRSEGRVVRAELQKLKSRAAPYLKAKKIYMDQVRDPLRRHRLERQSSLHVYRELQDEFWRQHREELFRLDSDFERLWRP